MDYVKKLNKEEREDKELIQSSTTPDRTLTKHKKHHTKESKEVRSFPAGGQFNKNKAWNIITKKKKPHSLTVPTFVVCWTFVNS